MHEVGHNYLMGILANNEWRETWLDEGFTSYQTLMFNESIGEAGGAGTVENTILLSDVEGWSQPVALAGEHFRDMSTYSAMTYSRGALFFHQLRRMLGDSTFRAVLRTYYDRWKLKHVDEAAFRAVAEEVSRRDLSTFFGQWLHSVALYDYSIGKVQTRGLTPSKAAVPSAARERGPEAGWITRVEVVRKSPGIFPVEVMALSGKDSALVRATGTPEREWVEFRTAGRPREILVDPRVESFDWNMLNNRKTRGLLGYHTSNRPDVFFDKLFWTRARRDRLTLGLVPALWYNDESGVVLGLRARSNYLGRFEQNQLLLGVDTRRRVSEDNGFTDRVGLWARFRNPVKLRMDHTQQTLELYAVEGRAGAAALVERQTNDHRTFGPQSWSGAGVRWLVTTATRYLDHALWDGGGTVEGSLWRRSSGLHGKWTTGAKLTVTGGVEYRNQGPGLTTDDAYDAQPFARLTGEATARRSFGKLALGVRGFGGWVESGRRPLKQRQLFVAGADPYEQFSNPFLRSRGSLLAGSDVHYRMPGGGGVRGAAAGTTATRLVALSTELERTVRFKADTGTTARQRTSLLREIHVGVFGDAAFGNGDIPPEGEKGAFLADVGIGIRMAHRIGPTAFVTRFDFPLIVTRPRLAARHTEDIVGIRWTLSIQ
jgi:hypothetical protein